VEIRIRIGIPKGFYSQCCIQHCIRFCGYVVWLQNHKNTKQYKVKQSLAYRHVPYISSRTYFDYLYKIPLLNDKTTAAGQTPLRKKSERKFVVTVLFLTGVNFNYYYLIFILTFDSFTNKQTPLSNSPLQLVPSCQSCSYPSSSSRLSSLPLLPCAMSSQLLLL
jgi:hypothetical protein